MWTTIEPGFGLLQGFFISESDVWFAQIWPPDDDQYQSTGFWVSPRPIPLPPRPVFCAWVCCADNWPLDGRNQSAPPLAE